MSRTLKIAGTITLLLLLAAFSMAAANAQTYPQPTNVTAENTTDGYVLVSWADDAAPVHRVGWTHDADFRAAEAAGDWLEAFHFADSKRDTDYTIKYLPRGQQYWFIVGTTNERFTGRPTANGRPLPPPTIPQQTLNLGREPLSVALATTTTATNGAIIRLLTPTQRPGGPSRRTTCRQETSPRTTTWPSRTLTFPADAIGPLQRRTGFRRTQEI